MGAATADRHHPQPGFEAAGHVENLRRDGYTIVENLLDAERLGAVRAGLEPFLGHYRGRNPFEGHTTERVYTLAARGQVFADIAEDPRILALLDAFLRPGYLLTASQAICILPGEARQGLHFDDSLYPLARPRAPLSLALILAVDAFTAENGATVIVPGSHLWGEAELNQVREANRTGRPCALLDGLKPVEMPAGPGVILSGHLDPWRRRQCQRPARAWRSPTSIASLGSGPRRTSTSASRASGCADFPRDCSNSWATRSIRPSLATSHRRTPARRSRRSYIPPIVSQEAGARA